MKFSLLCASFVALSFELFLPSKAHKQTAFQAERSLLSQEALLTPFPLEGNNGYSFALVMSNLDSPRNAARRKSTNGKDAIAILTADKTVITEGGDVKIMAELMGVDTSERDYFTIQCD